MENKVEMEVAEGIEGLEISKKGEKELRKMIIEEGFHSKIVRKDFQKIQLIGRGSVGLIYLVKHKQTGKYYAMKVMQKKDMIKRNKVQRALTEREVLVSANHPFIATLFYSFQTKKALYLIMKFCAGGEFSRVIKRQPKGVLAENAIRFYGAEILLALEYLHYLGVMYRDLKPENILMDSSGHINLTDFDLSKKDAPQDRVAALKNAVNGMMSEPGTVTNSFVGTEEYIAPEVIHGEGHTSAVDWWSFGILLYEMMVGRTPFRGSTSKDTFECILSKGPVWPIGCEISADGRDLVEKLLKKDPKRRLGRNGAHEIKAHRFFKGKIRWALLLNEKPPIIPNLKGPGDTRYFQYMRDEEKMEDEADITLNDDEVSKEEHFPGWKNEEIS